MSFTTRFQNSWRLFKQSLTVMKARKKLLVFPVLTAALTILIILFFLAPVALQPTGYGYFDIHHWKAVGETLFHADSAAQAGQRSGQLTNNGALLFAAIYFLSMFLATFFSVAFYHEIIRALKGRDVSITGGLKFAVGKLPAILVWSLFAGLIGYIIRTLEQRVGIVGRIVLSLVGIAWSVASVFAIPVIITETSVNPFYLLRHSAGILKKTWGESLIGYVGIQLGSLIFVLFTCIAVVGAMLIASLFHSISLVITAVALSLIGAFIFFYLMSVANSIYRCALYLFAFEGTSPAPFDEAGMQAAWKMKR